MGVRARFQAIDAALNLLLLTPLCVLFHVSTWCVLDAALLSRAPVLGSWLLLALAIAVESTVGTLQSHLRAQLPTDPAAAGAAPARYEPVVVVTHYALAVACVCHVRGVTGLLEAYVGSDAGDSVRVACTGAALLVGLRAARTVLTPPLYIAIDTHTDDFLATGSLNGLQADLSAGSVVDQVTTHAVLHSWVHLHWAGLWSLYDCIFSPLRAGFDVVFTWLLGAAASLVFIFAASDGAGPAPAPTRPPPADDKVAAVTAAVSRSALYLAANASTVLLWRATWMFFDGLMYYFPITHGARDVSCVYAHVLSFGLLAACRASASLAALGCDSDDDAAGRAGTFHCSFFGDFFKEEIEKLEAQEVTEPEAEAPAAVVLRKKPAVSAAEAEVRRVKRTSLEDVVNAEQRKREAKSKKH